MAAVLLLGVGPARASEPIAIRGPTVIGFFPPPSPGEADDPGAAEALAHLRFALDATASCLAALDPDVRLERTRELRLDFAGEIVAIRLPSEPERSVGAYLARPGLPPRPVFATLGASSLARFLPEAAADFFAVPGCRLEPLRWHERRW